MKRGGGFFRLLAGLVNGEHDNIKNIRTGSVINSWEVTVLSLEAFVPAEQKIEGHFFYPMHNHFCQKITRKRVWKNSEQVVDLSFVRDK